MAAHRENRAPGMMHRRHHSGAYRMRHEVFCQSIAKAFALQGAETIPHWDNIAALLTHSDKDFAWSRRRLVLG